MEIDDGSYYGMQTDEFHDYSECIRYERGLSSLRIKQEDLDLDRLPFLKKETNEIHTKSAD